MDFPTWRLVKNEFEIHFWLEFQMEILQTLGFMHTNLGDPVKIMHNSIFTW